MTLLLMPKREKTEEEKELERLERLDYQITSDANPQISIEGKKRIAELRKKLGGYHFYGIPPIFTLSQTPKGKDYNKNEMKGVWVCLKG